MKKESMVKSNYKVLCFIAFAALIVFSAFMLSGAWATFVEEISGEVKFSDGIKIEIENVRKTADVYSFMYYPDPNDTSSTEDLNISGFSPGDSLKLVNPQIRVSANSLPFYLRYKLNFKSIDGSSIKYNGGKNVAAGYELSPSEVTSVFSKTPDTNEKFRLYENWFYYTDGKDLKPDPDVLDLSILRKNDLPLSLFNDASTLLTYDENGFEKMLRYGNMYISLTIECVQANPQAVIDKEWLTIPDAGIKTYEIYSGNGQILSGNEKYAASSGDYILFGQYPQTYVPLSDSEIADLVKVDDLGEVGTDGYGNAFEVFRDREGVRFAKINRTKNLVAALREYSKEIGDTYYDGQTDDEVYKSFSGLTTSFDYAYSDMTPVLNDQAAYFRFDPIKWNVLDTRNGSVLLSASLALEVEPFLASEHVDNALDPNYIKNKAGVPENTNASNWEYSDIREYLNSNFYNTAFSSLQKDLIQEVTLDNAKSGIYTGNSGDQAVNDFASSQKATKDKVFLLSYQDFINVNYFGNSADYGSVNSRRALQNTDFALAKGSVNEDSGFGGKAGVQWARSWYYRSGENGGFVDVNLWHGQIKDFTAPCNYNIISVSPSVWIKLGTGTADEDNVQRIEKYEVYSESGELKDISLGYQFAKGDYILFGEYPQTHVPMTEEEIQALTKISISGVGATDADRNNLEVYKDKEGNRYAKIESTKTVARAYREYCIMLNGQETRTEEQVYQDMFGSDKVYDYHYTSGVAVENDRVAFFKFEPIKWRILSVDGSELAFIFADLALDTSAFVYTESITPSAEQNQAVYKKEGVPNRLNTNEPYYANCWEYSDLRDYLKINFFNTAFTSLQKQLFEKMEMDNRTTQDFSSSGGFFQLDPYKFANAQNNTYDSIFVLAYREMLDEDFFGTGASNPENILQSRMITPTDFVLAKGGCYESFGTEFKGTQYHTRSSGGMSLFLSQVQKNVAAGGTIRDPSVAIVPAAIIKIKQA